MHCLFPFWDNVRSMCSVSIFNFNKFVNEYRSSQKYNIQRLNWMRDSSFFMSLCEILLTSSRFSETVVLFALIWYDSCNGDSCNYLTQSLKFTFFSSEKCKKNHKKYLKRIQTNPGKNAKCNHNKSHQMRRKKSLIDLDFLAFFNHSPNVGINKWTLLANVLRPQDSHSPSIQMATLSTF